ncbi:hypothetical protein [Poritiphilus flavus]|uniref:Uncharacterized protein n=1 Tax=Poritiphilus flavus TaxID=2697053 RepID=A0A6L9EG47_9FLAO|nr:hypothetical protein [Poritiphilus flavus]NAS13229.1 hypothetical protein [Poritiphilus flavus]
MELEELKNLWTELSDELEKQKNLTDKIIMNMTQQRYTNKFEKITRYESVGAVICFLVAIGILWKFEELDTWYLKLCGGITLAFLLIMPVLVLRAIHQIKKLNILELNYRDTIVAFEKARNHLLMIQQFGIYLSFVLFFTTIPVASKLLSNKDFFIMEKEFSLYVLIGVVMVFLYFFARWGYRSYKKITNSAENILNELDNGV